MGEKLSVKNLQLYSKERIQLKLEEFKLGDARTINTELNVYLANICRFCGNINTLCNYNTSMKFGYYRPHIL